jgi:tRNA(Ile)-lysidine synthase
MLELSFTHLPFFTKVKRFIVAYSGGLDSHVLLHLISALRADLDQRSVMAVHVNHGLSENAPQWEAHCQARCAKLGVPLSQFEIDARAEVGESPEATAREGRYAIFASIMEEGDCLLTAHHEDDQAETLLLQLLRGAGPRGLAAMPPSARFADGWHARPLLGYSRDELLDYAQQHNLSWIDDESNSDTRFDRNFLRHEIMPKLKTRFPGMAATLSRSASLCAEAAELLANTAAEDLTQLQLSEEALSITGLQALGEIRARNLLHQWCRERNLPAPSAAQLQCVWDEVVGAAEDSEPMVNWPGGEARRYRDALFIRSPLEAHDAGMCIPWDGQHPLSLAGLGTLHVEKVSGQGIKPAVFSSGNLELRFRQGGEQLRPAGRQGHHALKKLFQEAAIPPWRRERIPLLYADEQLLAVVGLWVADEVAAATDEEGVNLVWVAQD